MELIKKLEMERAKLRAEYNKRQVTEDSLRQARALNLSKYQMIYDSCSSGMQNSEECRGALQNLAEYYYEKSKNEYVEKRDLYEIKMTEYEKIPLYRYRLTRYRIILEFSKVIFGYIRYICWEGNFH